MFEIAELGGVSERLVILVFLSPEDSMTVNPTSRSMEGSRPQMLGIFVSVL